jgi:thioredoxin reductase (NADPH)
MTKAIVITTGIDYRQLTTPGIEKFTGAGVYYGAANTEALACKEKNVFIVGGGNSAGAGGYVPVKICEASKCPHQE